MEMIELLREFPTDVVDEQEYTPLLRFLHFCEYPTQVIQWLVDRPGMEFSVMAARNCNLLHLAVENLHCKPSAVKLLNEHGVEVDELNWIGETPLGSAVRCSRFVDSYDIGVLKLLIDNGSPVN